jgi:asparagine synthase (glutamine-hydrolysing)
MFTPLAASLAGPSETEALLRAATRPGGVVLAAPDGPAVGGLCARHGNVLVAADARLDDEAGLRAELGAPGGSVPELFARVWTRWGADGLSRVHGDFAVVVWDGRALFAARDRYGVRPLAWRLGGRVASEVRQLLALGTPAPNDERVRAFLDDDAGAPRDTFFVGIERVPPGHVVRLDGAGARVERWHRPPALGAIRSFGERDEAFRERPGAAVEVRLDEPAVVQVSGGLDSAAIACAAARAPRPPLGLVHAAFPGFACDEERWAELVFEATGLPALRYDARPAAELSGNGDPSHPDRTMDLPLARLGQALAVARGARVTLTGHGGDSLLFERGIYRDLLRHGRVATMLRAARAPSYSVRPARFWLADAARGLVPRRLRQRRRGREPLAFHSHTQEQTWEWLHAPRLAESLELQHLAGAPAGIEYRHPFLDSRLADFVLSLPWELRVPAGPMKDLLRRPGILPPAIAARTDVTWFDDLHAAQIGLFLPIARETIERGPWLAGPWVSRARARELLAAFARSPAGWPAASRLWTVVELERWLRRM